MSWARATVERRCSFCEPPIPPGAPLRRGVNVAGYIWCASCASTRLGETVPEVLDDEVAPVVPPATPQPALSFMSIGQGLDLQVKREQRERRFAERAASWQRDGRGAQLGRRDR